MVLQKIKKIGKFILNKAKLMPIFEKIKVRYTELLLKFDYSDKTASNLITQLIKSKKPIMICRFGSVEIIATKDMDKVSNGDKFLINKFKYMQSNAGFFPLTQNNLKKFHDEMLNDMHEIDVLGSWRLEELYFKNELKNCIKIPLNSLEPFNEENPWTNELKNKKVLVIHPFEKTIKLQYNKRTKLFKNLKMLPKFKLKTIKAIQSIGGTDKFEDWFEALNYMKRKIDLTDFDIAIIGCGAYGLPLAAHIKRKGKQAIHLGGATQLLFGIKGKRWEETHQKLFNKYWVYPSEEEKPKNYKNVENGCYW